ncbi:PREDICTED: 5-hydroxytryptamine receptor 3A-like [Cyprinodon variegatus]|uniref:5-hydroxytryptamine receptor 3A-like n=1 Tax=Cyprinodon variegatus TaxID=28743 RepID=UPI000742A387|nr:PREDICTED: 5-hydroxytryptamine receptor 3A-like [Cyprinodon variegatus]
MAALRTLLLALAGFPCSRTSECSYFGLLDHLNMTTSNQALKISRPVKNWTSTTLVQLDMVLDGILDMDEKFQTITNHIWLKMYWINEFLIWNSSEFCGIKMLTVPSSMLWTPDIIIQEDSSNDGGSDEDPLLSVFSYGLVILNKRLQLTSACKFDFFRFPFDTQTCNISFSSMTYDESLMKLGKVMSDTLLTEVSEQIMLTAGEWKLVNITIINFTSVTMKSKLVYRILQELQRRLKQKRSTVHWKDVVTEN